MRNNPEEKTTEAFIPARLGDAAIAQPAVRRH